MLTRLFVGLHIVLVLMAGISHAGGAISPSFQGASGSVSISSGTRSLAISGVQLAASVMSAGAHVIESGFLVFLRTNSSVGVSNSNQPVIRTASIQPGQVTLEIPPGALPAGAVVQLVVPSTRPQPPAASNLVPLPDAAIEIVSSAQPARAALLTFSYANADLRGINPEQLVVAWRDADHGRWTPLASRVDTDLRTVTGVVKHFSLFGVMQSNASRTVSTVRVVPNPFRPSQGHAAMEFQNLPAGARVRVYTLTGELVKDLTANASGLAVWDGTNQSGRKAASGIYFALAEGAGERKTIKVAIQR